MVPSIGSPSPAPTPVAKPKKGEKQKESIKQETTEPSALDSTSNAGNTGEDRAVVDNKPDKEKPTELAEPQSPPKDGLDPKVQFLATQRLKTPNTENTGASTDSESSNSIRDLAPFSLQLPVAGPNGKAKIVKDIKGGMTQEDSQYFKQENGQLTFTAPANGATTKNSSHPRSELAQTEGWQLSSGSHSLSGTVSIDDGEDVTFAQLHQRKADGSKPRPPIMLNWKDGKVIASVMESNDSSAKRKEITLADNVPNDSKFSYNIQTAADGGIKLSVNGQSQDIKLDPSFNQDELYFKAGAYPQSGGAQVSYYGLGME